MRSGSMRTGSMRRDSMRTGFVRTGSIRAGSRLAPSPPTQQTRRGPLGSPQVRTYQTEHFKCEERVLSPSLLSLSLLLSVCLPPAQPLPLHTEDNLESHLPHSHGAWGPAGGFVLPCSLALEREWLIHFWFRFWNVQIFSDFGVCTCR